ncbi:hypothetical protein P7K49_019195 [Saguinus oedipus]|uniref:Coiled-coil domain-containing protein 181 n=1 Tax=Saguinus oedipus TaxID=9490 RepID=A0ABQ9UXM1_SAGOE|nr:hypothetical protein P7K49_019195 [Saguinus oedipus]
MLLPWQCGPGCCGGRCQGLPGLNVKNLERGGEENSPGHLRGPSQCILHRQKGYGGREGKGDAEILMVGEREMNENKDTDSKEIEEYEDDFEKNLEWIISENEKSDASIIEMTCLKEENINQDLKENETVIEHTKQLSDPDKSLQDEVSPRRNVFISVASIPYQIQMVKTLSRNPN